MNTDYYLERGKSHDVCEDYAWAGRLGANAYALVSDGCSSQPHTDFGARILVHAAINRLQISDGSFQSEEFARSTIETAARMARCLDSLPITSLDATLLLARVSPGSSPGMFSAEIFIWGDGLVAVKKGNHIQATLIRYTGNAPHYLAYHLDPQRERNYQQQRLEREIEQVTISLAGTATGATEPVGSPVTPFRASFEQGGGDALVLVSDGITQFFDGAGAQLPWENLVPEFISFKQSAGVFLKRRMNFFQRNNREHGITHADDLAVAAITL